MIPGLLAQEIARSLREFIVTGFETDTQPFAGKFDDLVNNNQNGEAFIKGPYISIGLPFKKHKNSRHDVFSGFTTEYSPFIHQQEAWSNLRSEGHTKSTLVATGTGSGKTECFLFPLLDHCQRNPGPGIKAIIIYPMNALATDQSKRFASVIHKTPELKGKLRVGLFVGGNERTDQTFMGTEEVITCKETLRKNPPDILLTNYKMLDYLLMRPKDQPLWIRNSPDTLRYLVVDELHTFDGAQGADLGMLIRRLKARLSVPKNHLICAGTSATLGSEDQMDDLAKFASDIFDTHFDRHSIIGETRQAYDDFLDLVDFSLLLNPAFDAEKLNPGLYPTLNDYLDAQTSLFFGDDHGIDISSDNGRQELGIRLKKSPDLHIVLQYLKKHGICPLQQLSNCLQKRLTKSLNNYAVEVTISLLSLLAHSRVINEKKKLEPLLTLRIQLWARELRRIVGRLGDDSTRAPVNLQFSDDLKPKEGEIFLPLIQCNECHSTAWLTRTDDNSSHIDQDLRRIYNDFFSSDKNTTILLPCPDGSSTFSVKGRHRYACPCCGHLQQENSECKSCQERSLVSVFQPDQNKQVTRGGVNKLESQRNCPVCQANSSLLLFGARAASLSSVAIHQLYASPVNDDKKLIAFSDSVQDAAHRAGFFAARTWQNNLRMAWAKTIATEDRPVPLADFPDMVTRFWTENPDNPNRFSDLEYITQFIPPNLQASDSWMTLKEQDDLPDTSSLLRQINQRLSWEVLLEFGLRSSIGRSLQKTGVATLGWDPELIVSAASMLKNSALDRLGVTLCEQQAAFILWGITIRMKRQGAIFHPIAKDYIESGGNWFMLSHKKIPNMPVSGSHFVQPRFPTEATESNLDALCPRGSQGWYQRWILNILGADSLISDPHVIKELSTLAMDALVDSQLVSEHKTLKNNKVWALNLQELKVYRDVAHLHLIKKNDKGISSTVLASWVVPSIWQESIVDMPPLDLTIGRSGQPATYQTDLTPKISFYKNYYLNGQIQRVFAHEHTALLERTFREDLEKRFIKRKHAWDTNLLSATPTLEMGIDIGDLSSVLLCSVPPSQANYLQRAGRGGRRDGNSFVLTLANGHPHDLFFYANPLNMIAGHVEAPAIFLNASMVLRRQLLAFCFDQWGMKKHGKHLIPVTMQPVLDAVESENLSQFPYTLLDFIKKHRDTLWEQFESLLDQQISVQCRDKLHQIMLGTSREDDPLDIYVLTAIQKFVEQRKNLSADQKALDNELKKLRKKPEDEAVNAEIKEFEAELAGIKRLKYQLNKKDTFNFFTDEGLLPNYAFPEEGTTLHSVIYRKLTEPRQNKDGSTTNFDTRTFEYIRPAHAALSELAPESLFYASNRKVKIHRVEMARGKNLQYWRLCPNCSYSKEITGPELPACPRCNEVMWANVSQKKPLLRLQQVYANTSEDDAQIGDDSDTREPIFFNRQMLIDFEPHEVEHAFALDSDAASFGFEFIRKVAFREVNFGKQGGSDQIFNVAGKELARPGFRVCQECGMVQHQKNKAQHLFKCQYKNADANKGIIDCLYLYREYHSEAIRILMPNLFSIARDQQTESFVAAIQLGLKKRFGGKVDHIHIALNDEPIPGSTERANYLVLYDSVPGGTGYLHELLATPENLIDVLKMARDVLANCDCQHIEDLDGCYSCLYAYRNSYGMEQTSRETALEMLANILDGNPTLKKVDNLGVIKKDPWVDSELEARFPEAIRKLNKHPMLDNLRVRVNKDIIKGKLGFRLEIGDIDYSVELHARLSEKDGAAYPCEPDFLITADRESLGLKPVAVFLDGWKYHKDSIQEDLIKRQGLTLSGKFQCWSLTWHDIHYAFAGNQAKTPNPLKEHIDKSHASAIGHIAAQNELNDHGQLAELPPLFQLLKYLSRPEPVLWNKFATLRSLCWLDQKVMQSPNTLKSALAVMKNFPAQFMDCAGTMDLKLAGITQFGNADMPLTMSTVLETEAIKTLDNSSLLMALVFDSRQVNSKEAQRHWQKLLQHLNLIQFIKYSFATTAAGLESGSYANLIWTGGHVTVTPTPWDEVLQFADEDVHALLGFLAKQSAKKPEVAYEFANEKGKIIAMAELAWPAEKVAFLLDDQIDENQSEFDKMGWTVVTQETAMEVIIQLVGA